ncbi:MAG: hypothetical protein ACQCN3_10010 [Candidatus Bathyarchaeia archaeon]|jgi:hypothetical protein
MNKVRFCSTATLMLTATLILSLTGVELASANYCPPPSIEIFQPYSAAVYSNSSVPLMVRVNVLTGESWITSIRYSIDDGAPVKLTNLTREETLWYWTETVGVLAHGEGFSTTATIENLQEGNHTLTVYSHASDGEEMSRSITLIVDYGYVPPENPFSLPNGTSILTPTPTETFSSVNEDSLQPLQNWLPFLIIALIVGSFATVLFFRKNPNNYMLKSGKAN